jgi:2-keto-3-deoxy-L-rhamnonate aldolase RhmA
MTGHQVREALHAGRRVYGSSLTNPLVWVIGNYTGLDFVFIDNEHVPLGRETTMALCQAYKAKGIAPIVRIPVADPIRACTVLDAGADGIICPYMEDADQVREMVGAVKYRPLKGQKLASFLHRGTGVNSKTLRYLEERNRNSLLIINVESLPAVNDLDELLGVEGLDGVLIGPHDLSISLDIPEEYENPEFVETAELIIAKARRAGLGAGIHYWQGLDRECYYIERGANLIVHSLDVYEAAKAINSAISHIRAAFGDIPEGKSGDTTTV